MRIGKRFREGILALILLLGLLPPFSFGTEIQIKSDTLLRVFERDTADKRDASVLPGYEYLQVDAGHLEDYGLALHLYGWGRADFADNDYYDDRTDGELLYGYLEYRLQANRFSARLGRQYVFEGVANEAIDGLRVSSELGEYFAVSAYGGQPVGLASEQGRSGDSIYGGRLSHHLGTHYEVGVSYKKSENDSDTAADMLGVDLSLFLPANLSLFGYSKYNNETDDWAEHSYELRIPVGSVLFKPYVEHFSYQDYFGTGANAVNPFRGLAHFDEELTAYGVDTLWTVNANWTLGGKVKLFEYDQLDSAQLYSVLATWQDDEEQTRIGGELGRSVSGDTADNEYTLVRLYGYCEAMAGRTWIDFFSGDLLLTYYDEPIYGEDNSLFISLGTGKRFMDDALTVKVSGDYSQDPYFDDDLRGMLTVSYTYDNQ